jgi:hypothetical protein
MWLSHDEFWVDWATFPNKPLDLIGVGPAVTRRPCHTTVRAGPYCQA